MDGKVRIFGHWCPGNSGSFYQTQRYIKNIIPIIKIIAIEQNSINIRKWSNNGSCKYVKDDSLIASACCLIVPQLLDSPFWLFEEFLSNETFSIFISFFNCLSGQGLWRTSTSSPSWIFKFFVSALRLLLYIPEVFAHQPRRPWTKARTSATTFGAGTRASKSRASDPGRRWRLRLEEPWSGQGGMSWF